MFRVTVNGKAICSANTWYEAERIATVLTKRTLKLHIVQ